MRAFRPAQPRSVIAPDVSGGAEADLLSIGVYTLRTEGEPQTIPYIDNLEDCCRQLADSPTSGRSCDHIRPGLYRMVVGKHVIFFRRVPARSGASPRGILAVTKPRKHRPTS